MEGKDGEVGGLEGKDAAAHAEQSSLALLPGVVVGEDELDPARRDRSGFQAVVALALGLVTGPGDLDRLVQSCQDGGLVSLDVGEIGLNSFLPALEGTEEGVGESHMA